MKERLALTYLLSATLRTGTTSLLLEKVKESSDYWESIPTDEAKENFALDESSLAGIRKAFQYLIQTMEAYT